MTPKDKALLRKLIKVTFTAFARAHGFHFHSPRILVREREQILHIIDFDLGTAGFTCDVAIQPLFVPDDVIVLSFGNRISQFKTVMRERWPYGEEEECKKGLEEIRLLLQRDALPWFDKVSSVSGMVAYLEEHDPYAERLRLTPWLKYLYMGFGYLGLKRYQEGVDLLRKVDDYFVSNKMQWDWVLRWKQLVEEMISLVSTDPELVEKRLAEYADYTRNKIGIGLRA